MLPGITDYSQHLCVSTLICLPLEHSVAAISSFHTFSPSSILSRVPYPCSSGHLFRFFLKPPCVSPVLPTDIVPSRRYDVGNECRALSPLLPSFPSVLLPFSMERGVSTQIPYGMANLLLYRASQILLLMPFPHSFSSTLENTKLNYQKARKHKNQNSPSC